MLDLRPIKNRLEMASPDKGRRVGYPPDADLQNNAYDDLTALVDEVEQLRRAIEAHRSSILDGGHPLHEDVTLWAVLDA